MTATETLATISSTPVATTSPTKANKAGKKRTPRKTLADKVNPKKGQAKASKLKGVTYEQAVKNDPTKPGLQRINSADTPNHRGFCQADIAVDIVDKPIKSINKKPVEVKNTLSSSGAHRAIIKLPSGATVTTTQLFQALGAAEWSTGDAKTLCSKLGVEVCSSTFGCKMGAGRAYTRGDITPTNPKHGHGNLTAILEAIKAVKPDMPALKKLVGIS